MNVNKCLLKSINDSLDNKGMQIELSKNFNKDFFDINEEINEDNIRTYLSCNVLDSHMFLFTFAKMLGNGEIEIKFKKNASEKDLKYLEKLSESL